jgi:protein-S-isoprenylcysteine O-methyltransferase Ste14
MRKSVAAAGSAVFFLVGPGVLVGLVPWWLTRWELNEPLPYWIVAQVLGVVLILPGLIVAVQAFARFVTEGRGTPVPVAAPDRLVIGGAYRYVRNPMYVALLAALIGQALLFGSWSVLVVAAVLWLATASFVHWHEEPALRRRFGAQYEAYLKAVPGWLPRLRPWTPADPA